MGLTAEPDPLLRDWDLGRWRGRTLDEVAATEPEGIGRWLTDPTEAPHGGEPLAHLLERAATWLATASGDGHTVAITHSAVIRGVILAVLAAPAPGFWRIDIAPLTTTVLRGSPGRWTIRSTGQRLTTGGPERSADRHDGSSIT